MLINVECHAVELRTVWSQDHYSIKGICRSGRLSLTIVSGLGTQVEVDLGVAGWRQVTARPTVESTPISISKEDGDSIQRNAGKLSADVLLDK